MFVASYNGMLSDVKSIDVNDVFKATVENGVFKSSVENDVFKSSVDDDFLALALFVYDVCAFYETYADDDVLCVILNVACRLW